MKLLPIISYTITDTLISSAVFNYPKENWWYALQGVAEIKTDSGNITQKKNLGVYRNNQNWFIYPPDNTYEWIKRNPPTNISPEELNKFLQIVEQSNSPIKIIESSVKINSEDFSKRNYTFKVINKSQKEISYFGYTISSKYGSYTTSFSQQKILSNQIVLVDEKQSLKAYRYLCDGEIIHKIYITFVHFEDGTQWNLDKVTRNKLK